MTDGRLDLPPAIDARLRGVDDHLPPTPVWRAPDDDAVPLVAVVPVRTSPARPGLSALGLVGALVVVTAAGFLLGRAPGNIGVGSSKPTSSATLPAVTQPPLAFSRVDGIQFLRPADWREWQPNEHHPRVGGPLLYLSNVDLNPDCATPPGHVPNPPDENGYACDRPLDALPARGVLLTVYTSRILHPLPADGELLAAGRARTHMRVERPGSCGGVGAEETVEAWIPSRSSGFSNLALVACFRGPGVDDTREQAREIVLSMLRWLDRAASGPTLSPEPSPNLAFEGALTVSELRERRLNGEIGGESVVLRGYWTDRTFPHSCAAPIEPPAELEYRCHDTEYGITEHEEPIGTLHSNGIWVNASGPFLTPWIPEEIAETLFSLRGDDGQPHPPVPIVVSGHFDDPRAGDCSPERRLACRERFVIEELLHLGSASARSPSRSPSPEATATTPPTALPPDAVLGCSGGPPYFAPDALAGEGTAESGDDPAAASLRAFLRTADAASWPLPAIGWYRVADDGQEVLFLAHGTPEAPLVKVGMSLTDHGWQVDRHGQCFAITVLSEDVQAGEFWIDPERPVTPKSTVLHGFARELECANGEPPGERLLDPVVTYTNRTVVVTIPIRRLGGDCPGNPATPVTVALSEPVGDRMVLDGGRFPLRDATTIPE